MNETERAVMAHLEREGFRVLRNGWPDFLALRKAKAGWDIWAIEVKAEKDTVSEAQENMHRALTIACIPFSLPASLQIIKCVSRWSGSVVLKPRPPRIDPANKKTL